MKYDFDIAVIGAGSGGLTVAEISSNLGLKTVLFEGSKMGGDCLNYGCVPSKAMIKSANIAHIIDHAEKYGIQLNGKREDNWDMVKERIARIIEKISHDDSQERFENELGVTVIREYASFVDKHILKAGDKEYSAKKIFIASGSSPFIPPIEGLSQVGYETNETIFYMEGCPKRWLVIGGGPIGSELGQSLQYLGCDVTLVNRGSHIMGPFDEDIAIAASQSFEQDGLSIINNADTKKVWNEGASIKALIEVKGGEEVELEFDRILVATGRKPNLDKLNLDEIGIKYDKRQIFVDEYLRTNIKHIYAIGDINRTAMFTHGAGFEAFSAAKHALYKLPGSKVDYSVLPAVVYTNPEVAIVGLTEKEAKEKGINYTVTKASFDHLDRAVTDENNYGFCKILIDRWDHIIGAQIIGPSAGELIHEIALCMHTKQKASAIATMIHSYPTLSDINRLATFEYYKPKWYSTALKKWVKFWF